MIPENAVAIRVVQKPRGEAPERYRVAQVGLVFFPATPVSANEAAKRHRGLETRELMPGRESYSVPTEVVVAVLRQKDRSAAAYFYDLESSGCLALLYAADEIEVIG